MKNIVVAFLLLHCLAGFCQNSASTADEKKTEALLSKLNSRQASADEKADLEKIAIALQNKGQDPSDNQHQYKKSLANIDKAIVLFTALEDTVSIANNRKFKSYLLGQYSKFPEAKKELQSAIGLYASKKMSVNVAVAEFDLARIFEFQNKFDSAIHYADQSRIYWKSKEAGSRVLLTNNMLVSLLLKQNEPEKAKMVQAESNILLRQPDIHWQAIIDFYFTSMLLYKALNDLGIASDYQRLYLAKVAELNGTGVNARSYYERERE